MLFLVTWEFIDTSEEGQARTLQLFSKWQPGPGEFKGFYGFADGTGGVALIEADTSGVRAVRSDRDRGVVEVVHGNRQPNRRSAKVRR